jgi:hypothetical protein
LSVDLLEEQPDPVAANAAKTKNRTDNLFMSASPETD